MRGLVEVIRLVLIPSMTHESSPSSKLINDGGMSGSIFEVQLGPTTI